MKFAWCAKIKRHKTREMERRFTSSITSPSFFLWRERKVWQCTWQAGPREYHKTQNRGKQMLQLWLSCRGKTFQRGVQQRRAQHGGQRWTGHQRGARDGPVWCSGWPRCDGWDVLVWCSGCPDVVLRMALVWCSGWLWCDGWDVPGVMLGMAPVWCSGWPGVMLGMARCDARDVPGVMLRMAPVWCSGWPGVMVGMALVWWLGCPDVMLRMALAQCLGWPLFDARDGPDTCQRVFPARPSGLLGPLPNSTYRSWKQGSFAWFSY